MTTIAPGYSTHAGTYTVPTLPKTSHRRLLIVWVAAIGLVAAGLVAMSGAMEKPSAVYVCPPDCGRPPIGEPVTINPRFTSADGAFSVVLSRRGFGLQDHHQTGRRHGRPAGRRRRHDAVVQRARRGSYTT